jgi:uncharacterized membrane protein YphA (DoxX/SURF4 family)
VTSFFTDLGIPAPALNAWFISGLEFGGGLLLILGLGSRLIALPLVIDMLVAYVVADREAFFSFITNPDKFTGVAPYNFLFISLIVLIFGAGKISLDTSISVIVFPRVDAKRWSNRPRPYVDLRNQCPVDRTFIGDLEQPGTLFPG